MVSSENVEKVVKPPQKPTPSNNLIFDEINSRSPNPYINIPKMKLPKKLTAKVPNGNISGKNFITADDTQYRNPPPAPAPKKTIKYFTQYPFLQPFQVRKV